MLKIYCTDMKTNVFEEINEFKKGSWINLTNPSEAEIKKVCENINIQEGFIRDALDFEEKARIDTEEDDGTTLFVVDVPIIEKDKEHDENDIYTTMPLGMIFVRDDYFITVSLRKNKVNDEVTTENDNSKEIENNTTINNDVNENNMTKNEVEEEKKEEIKNTILENNKTDEINNEEIDSKEETIDSKETLETEESASETTQIEDETQNEILEKTSNEVVTQNLQEEAE